MKRESLVSQCQGPFIPSTMVSALNISRAGEGAEAYGGDVDDNEDDSIPLEERILDVIDACPDREIRPGRLVKDLGLSIEEASAELSFLLAAVGGGYDGATFRFEDVAATTTTTTTKTMVFTFPTDFRRRLSNRRRQEDWQRVGREMLQVVVKILQIVTAFGLIVSLFILSVAAILSLIAAMIAMSRVEGGGGHRHRSLLMHQVRAIIYALKEILWLYAVFGPTTTSAEGESTTSGGGGDPFFKEVAYDLYLFFSLCCGNPGGIFFWLRANQWRSRQRSRAGTTLLHGRGRTFASDIPGVTLMANGNRWGDDADDDTRVPAIDDQASRVSQRGFLSVVVEFLFSPAPFAPGPSPHQIGLLRAAVLSKLSFANNNTHNSIALEQLSPYVDHPPTSLDDIPTIVQQGLIIVGYFHGVPSANSWSDSMLPTKASFCFPELCAESTISLPRTLFRNKGRKKRFTDIDGGIRRQALLYDAAATLDESSSSSVSASGRHNADPEDDVPSFLQEDLYQLTRLTPQQFYQCVGLGALNLVGVLWLRQSFQSFSNPTTTRTGSNGVKLPSSSSSLATVVVGQILLPVLLFYALLFFALPLGRLVCVVIWNRYRMQRNRRRLSLSHQLKSQQQQQQSQPSETMATTTVVL